jgi:aminoglycoside phosphotransferase
MSASLEPDVVAALAEWGVQPRSFHCISAIRAPEIGRAAYRIDTADGRTMKARRLEDEAIAQRLVELRRTLPRAFGPVLARHGRVLLEEWVPGVALGHEPPGRERLAQAGTVLGELHALAALDDTPLHGSRETARHREIAEAGLQQVVAAGALDPRGAEALSRRMRRLDPGKAINGLVHFDFCGENIVVDRAGDLRVVDNDRMGVDALGFDLARAWYRWALPDAEWQHLQSAYAACLPFSEPVHTLPFWRLVTLARAAALRLRTCPDWAGAPIDGLRRLSMEPEP